MTSLKVYLKNVTTFSFQNITLNQAKISFRIKISNIQHLSFYLSNKYFVFFILSIGMELTLSK